MKIRSFNFVRVIVLAIPALLVVDAVKGQNTPAPSNTPTQTTTPRPQRPALFQQLGLTPDQIQKIRQLNMLRKPQMEAAQKLLQAATKSLDQAIYADELNEADIADKIKEVQLAQAEMQKLRFSNELAVRKILTPEQLLRFRELRAKFAEARQKMNGMRRRGDPAGPNGRRMNRFKQSNRPGDDPKITRPVQP